MQKSLFLNCNFEFYILNFELTEKRRGFTLVETLVGVAVFALIAMGIYAVFTQTTQLVRASRARIVASALANEQIEIIRNLPYANVGTLGGAPAGVLPAVQTITRDGIPFSVSTTIRNVDDPFDGTIGGTPNDTAPADYKLIEVSVSCSACTGNPPLVFTSTAAPKSLEAASNHGSLFIRVFDANGQPVPQASVVVTNLAINPPVNINDVTNNSGVLQLVDVPTSTESYQMIVTKTDYSTDQTSAPGAPDNPNPTKPHASVLTQQVTQTSFAIDRVSTMNITAVNQICGPVANANFHINGAKLIGTNPDLLKYSYDFTTDGNGARNLTHMEWDSYTLTLTDAFYDLAGSIPLNPVNLVPNAIMPITLVLQSHTNHSLLVTVVDNASQLPLTESQVRLTGTGIDQTLETNRGYALQTDWSGGGNQSLFLDPARYYDNDGGLDATTTLGDIKLKSLGSNYSASGVITSSTFDLGSGTNYVTVDWRPTDQPILAGENSVRMQLASNNDNASWNFVGPDGTASSYYVPGQNAVHSSHNGNRYIRYRVVLQTADASVTPNVSDISLTFVNGCVPPGQVFFSNLTAQTYTLEAGHSGYATNTDEVLVSGRTTYTNNLSP